MHAQQLSLLFAAEVCPARKTVPRSETNSPGNSTGLIAEEGAAARAEKIEESFYRIGNHSEGEGLQ